MNRPLNAKFFTEFLSISITLLKIHLLVHLLLIFVTMHS